jgi:hypothetical protein
MHDIPQRQPISRQIRFLFQEQLGSVVLQVDQRGHAALRPFRRNVLSRHASTLANFESMSELLIDTY